MDFLSYCCPEEPREEEEVQSSRRRCAREASDLRWEREEPGERRRVRPWPRAAGGFVASRLKSNIARFHVYNKQDMNALVQLLSKVLVPLFFIGMAGSLLVVIFTVVRDLRQVLSKKDEVGGPDL